MPDQEVRLDGLICDLESEHEELDAFASGLDPGIWDHPTPAEGWSVRDQISHLAFFDDVAVMALSEPGSFVEAARSASASGDDPMEEHLRRGRAMSPRELLEWWRTSRREMVRCARRGDGATRVPWFGPPMGLKSFVSARLMETWAHGQDIFDALGSQRVPTARLRHIAHLGVRARGFSYVVRGLEAPSGTVSVELEAPSGELWAWEDGEEPAASKVLGSALEFCLVVTQRRNLADTKIQTEGDLAAEWMGIAQAFAGRPGPGRAPGGLPPP